MSQKKLRINKGNMIHGGMLLLVFAILGALFLPQNNKDTSVLYAAVACMTGFMFPWIELVDVEDEP